MHIARSIFGAQTHAKHLVFWYPGFLRKTESLLKNALGGGGGGAKPKVPEDVKQGLYVYITFWTGVLLGLSWLRVEANTCASFCIRSQSGRLSAKRVNC
jgi:hypothetical protein